ncbi:MAG TPA: class D sortase [Terriglobales bacterium]|jgi:sortase A
MKTSLPPRQRRWRAVERLLLVTGIALLGVYIAAQCDSFLFSRIAIWGFDTTRANAATVGTPSSGDTKSGSAVDFTLWGKGRIKAYQASLGLKMTPPIALLNIPRLHLTAPVFDGTDDITLNRGVGRIVGTAVPGEDGNMGIAGHRDGFFRGLKDIQTGDLISLEETNERDTYVVDKISIVDPRDVVVLQEAEGTTVTLVTCYPFYFIGDAPFRYIVKASLKQRDPLQQARAFPADTQPPGKAK